MPARKKLKNEKKAQVESFLLLDENSTVLPGKKDTVGRKEKRQRRVLTSSLKDLHKTYMQKCENRQFIRYKPFYVTEARSSDRNTCACWEHANISLLSDALSSRGLITTRTRTG